MNWTGSADVDRMLARRAVYKGMHIWIEEASKVSMDDAATRATLFGQRAR